MGTDKTSFVVSIEELRDPSDDENERAARDASVSVAAIETIPPPPDE